jgi:excisionase family DNA binding protein
MSTTPITSPYEWLDTDAAAAYLGLSMRQIRRARESRRLAFVKLGGQRVFHSREMLDDFVRRSTVTAIASAVEDERGE